ncbi:MAG: LytR family transcriptional regulator, partial [Aeromicrobium sp.]|nr:LytR family transcriptional regulator [Aeromicrobium sp.]
MTHRASVLGRGYQDRHLDSPRVRFRRAILLVLLTIIAPGSAQIALGKKVIGWFALTIWVALLGVGGYLLYTYRTDRATFLGWFTNSDVLMQIRIAVVVLALLWLVLFVDAWRLGSTFRLTFFRAAMITIVNIAIIGSVAGSAAYAQQLIRVSRDTVTHVFVAKKTSKPLQGRYNILLLGSDA